MATRAAIIMEVKGEDYAYKAVYLHFDGYPEGAGRILNNHYKTPARVSHLISQGGISVLGEMIGEKFEFDEGTPPQQCRFYHRDRGEDLDIALLEDDGVEDYADGCGAGYIYLFENGKWLVKDVTSRRVRHYGFEMLNEYPGIQS